jgi:hypothetical protein
MMPCELYGHVDEKGQLTIQNKGRLKEWLSHNKEKNVVIRVERRKARRSNQANRYYWGVVVQEVRLGLIEIGYDLTADETHFFLKSKFNVTMIANKDGEGLEVPGTTTTLNKVEFGEYIERIARWSAEYLSIVIPAPDAALTMFK